jgi:hypothetical protein
MTSETTDTTVSQPMVASIPAISGRKTAAPCRRTSSMHSVGVTIGQLGLTHRSFTVPARSHPARAFLGSVPGQLRPGVVQQMITQARLQAAGVVVCQHWPGAVPTAGFGAR